MHDLTKKSGYDSDMKKEEPPPGAVLSDALFTKMDTNGDDTKSSGVDAAAIISVAVMDETKIESESGGPELNKLPMNERRRFLIQVRMIVREIIRDAFGISFSNRCGHWLDRHMTHLVWKYGYWLDYPAGHHVFEVHSGLVLGAAVSTDGRFLFTAGVSESIIVWDLLDHSMLKQFDAFDKVIYCLIYERDLLVSAAENKKIRIFNGITHELIGTLGGHSDCVRSLKFNKECSKLLSASEDKSVKIWCIRTGNCLLTLTGHIWCVYSAYFMDNDTKVISGSMDDTIKVWTVNDKIEPDIITKGLKDQLYDMCVNCDSSLVACCSGFEGIMIYNWPNMDIVRTVKVKACRGQFHPSNPDIFAVTDSYSKSVNVCNVRSGDIIAEFEGHSYEINVLCWSTDGSLLISVSEDNTVRVWNCTLCLKYN